MEAERTLELETGDQCFHQGAGEVFVMEHNRMRLAVVLTWGHSAVAESQVCLLQFETMSALWPQV